MPQYSELYAQAAATQGRPESNGPSLRNLSDRPPNFFEEVLDSLQNETVTLAVQTGQLEHLANRLFGAEREDSSGSLDEDSPREDTTINRVREALRYLHSENSRLIRVVSRFQALGDLS